MLVAQAVVEPGSDARTSRDLVAALHECHAGSVVDALGVHRADEAESVGHLGRVRQQLRQPGAAVAMLGEGVRGADERDRALVARHPGEPLAAPDAVGQLLPCLCDEQRLVVVEVELGWTTRLKEIDHPLRLGRVMEAAEHAPAAVGADRRPAKHLREGDPTETHPE